MRNFLYKIIGISSVAYLIYVLVQVGMIVFGTGSSWSDVSIHLIILGVLIALIIIGELWGDEKEGSADNSKSPSQAGTTEGSTNSESSSYNPLVDKLVYSVYQQDFESWWYDNDGEKHHHSTIYANLRFYEDGTVIGIRSSIMPKREFLDSFTMKGNWTTEKNRINLQLDKVSDKDDSISIQLSESDRREMKYYGKIADDDSLIKAGDYQGTIKANTICIGDHVFSRVPLLKLILTSEEGTCEALESRFKSHPLMVNTFQNTGNWYSNGETGPEWFTVNFTTAEKSQKEVEALVKDALIELDGSGNFFWDWG